MVFCRNCGKDLRSGNFVIIWDGDKRVTGTIKEIVEQKLVGEDEFFDVEYLEKVTVNDEIIELPDAVFCSSECEEEFSKTMEELFSDDEYY